MESNEPKFQIVEILIDVSLACVTFLSFEDTEAVGEIYYHISLLLNQKQCGVAFSSQVWNNFEFLAFKSELEFSYVYIYFEDVED